MTSALAGLANATATFQLPTTGTTTEAATGNVVPNTEAVTVTMFLRSSNTRGADFPGVDVGSQTMEGYAVAPQALDSRIIAGITGVLTFGSDAPACCVVIDARFPFGNTGTLGGTLQRVLGDKIRVTRFTQGQG